MKTNSRLCSCCERERVNESELREYLRASLPDYMVPPAIVILERLPLNANGKVDRQALPSPEEVRSEDDSVVAVALSPTEEMLSGIWTEDVARHYVGAQREFLRTWWSLITRHEADLPNQRSLQSRTYALRMLFESPTVSFWRYGSTKRCVGDGSETPPLAAGKRRGSTLSFAQQSLWFLDQFEEG